MLIDLLELRLYFRLTTLGGYVRPLKLFALSLASSLVFAALALSVPAASSSSPTAWLGMVMSAENSRSGVDPIYSGATIYDGDRLVTEDDGAMRVRLGTGQLFLHQATSVQMHAFPKGFSALLDTGTVSVSSPEGETFQVLADGASIRPASSHPTAAQIERISPTEVVLISTRGDLQVTMGDEVETVSAGASYKLVVDPAAAAPEPAGSAQGPFPAGHRPKLFYIVVFGAVGAVTGVLIWRALESPDAPR